MQNRRIVDGHLAETGVESHVVVETDTISAIYAHVSSMGISSVVPHTWLPAFGVPHGIRVIEFAGAAPHLPGGARARRARPGVAAGAGPGRHRARGRPHPGAGRDPRRAGAIAVGYRRMNRRTLTCVTSPS
ncbi:hypothetical protein [Nocardioides convexus]|uniref:hypothetical protein n=1 Tax=Nocardioides convexus TaxID=2712224 RepID=UPI002418BA2F|nr:hypothetical protein [Nocardioides convexus]